MPYYGPYYQRQALTGREEEFPGITPRQALTVRPGELGEKYGEEGMIPNKLAGQGELAGPALPEEYGGPYGESGTTFNAEMAGDPNALSVLSYNLAGLPTGVPPGQVGPRTGTRIGESLVNWGLRNYTPLSQVPGPLTSWMITSTFRNLINPLMEAFWPGRLTYTRPLAAYDSSWDAGDLTSYFSGNPAEMAGPYANLTSRPSIAEQQAVLGSATGDYGESFGQYGRGTPTSAHPAVAEGTSSAISSNAYGWYGESPGYDASWDAYGDGGGGAGGGKIICTWYHQQGLLDSRVWASDESYAQQQPWYIVKGYQRWAKKVLEFMVKHPWSKPYILKFAKPWAEEMAHRDGYGKGNLFGKIILKVGLPVCKLFGRKYKRIDSTSKYCEK